MKPPLWLCGALALGASTPTDLKELLKRGNLLEEEGCGGGNEFSCQWKAPGLEATDNSSRGASNAEDSAAEKPNSNDMPLGASPVPDHFVSEHLRSAAFAGTASLGNALGDMVKQLLERSLDEVNHAIQALIPHNIHQVYSSYGSESTCCIHGFFSCWCTCELGGSVQVEELTNADTLMISQISSVTTGKNKSSGALQLDIEGEWHISDLACSGAAHGSTSACGLNISVPGVAKMTASITGRARMVGTPSLKFKNGNITGGCFHATDVSLEVGKDDVQYSEIEVGLHNLHGAGQFSSGFWKEVIKLLPTQPLIDSITAKVEPALEDVLSKEFCF